MTDLFVAEHFCDLWQCLAAPDDKTMLDRQRYRASDPFTLANRGGSHQIVSFRHSPKYTVLLWQQRQVRRGTNAMKGICTNRLHQ